MLVVVKPSAAVSTQRHLDWVKKQIQCKKMTCDWFFTTGNFINDVKNIRQLSQGQDVVVVIGGDGTLHLVINAIVGLTCRFALLPAGTGNDFARQFGYSLSQWRQSIFSTKYSAVDVGKVNSRYFVNMMGVGFSAKVVRAIKSQNKRNKLSYVWAGLLNLVSYQSVKVASSLGHPTPMMMMLIANGRYFAAGLPCAPSADAQNGTLTCLEFHADSLITRLMTFLLMLFAQHERLSIVHKTESQQFSIDAVGLDIEADGEIIGETPAHVSCFPKAIEICIL
ncbi:YegS/Rv2252/BmrU family lipid kinase [Pseudoalteromonas sp. MMG013]|uniref:diacylglycerol/lipid kinase family protein n=1 Tax=Pseudoalteromonas sp. MMG013 TaxID=2822687 RepID=UPI001B366AC8|nr:YegS/Rv2252/BmrU family lipid kinase [Pseudoalteromonas sp. MMG013]MBQ4863375.1 YegS/Rv2252/BmrU family lipid kinase [Pseudoalteromonas sp. MMG013]